MNEQLQYITVGALISLLSSVITVFVQHRLEISKLRIQSKHQPMQIVYIKQTEFIEKVTPLLQKINSFITTLDVWLGESGPHAKKEVSKSASNNSVIMQFDDLIQSYFAFLPEELIAEANELFMSCISLSGSPSTDKSFASINLLFKFQNNLRKLTGIEQLSQDLLETFGTKRKIKSKNTSGAG